MGIEGDIPYYVVSAWWNIPLLSWNVRFTRADINNGQPYRQCSAWTRFKSRVLPKSELGDDKCYLLREHLSQTTLALL